MPSDRPVCVLMFSGGRDSTLAAVRLARQGWFPVLVTVTTVELYGLSSVRQRLKELEKYGMDCEWHQVAVSRFVPNHATYPIGCFACQQAYIAIGASVAKARSASDLALGYSGYQAFWPEQTPLAVRSLRKALNTFGYSLHLPVYDLKSKEEAISELTATGLSGDALEQKCLRQALNQPVEEPELRKIVAAWTESLVILLEDRNLLEYDVLSVERLTCA